MGKALATSEADKTFRWRVAANAGLDGCCVLPTKVMAVGNSGPGPGGAGLQTAGASRMRFPLAEKRPRAGPADLLSSGAAHARTKPERSACQIRRTKHEPGAGAI
jgi:hypothetical protein